METTKYSFEDLLKQIMQQANEGYRMNAKLWGQGFIVGKHPAMPGEKAVIVVNSHKQIDTLDDLRNFTRAVHSAVRMTSAEVAAVVVELPIAVIESAEEAAFPLPSVVLYVDQKFGGIRLWIAPKMGDSLVFRDFGNAHPATNFLPHLIPTEAYGPVAAEA